MIRLALVEDDELYRSQLREYIDKYSAVSGEKFTVTEDVYKRQDQGQRYPREQSNRVREVKFTTAYSNRQTVRIGGLPVLLYDAAGAGHARLADFPARGCLFYSAGPHMCGPALHGTARPDAGSRT